jgi:peptidoglycan/xylan/chitin deacetylase (PgdA/CDA1 family)
MEIKNTPPTIKSLIITLVSPKKLLRIKQSLTLSVQISGGNTDPREYSFRWWTSAGTITKIDPGNKATFIAPDRKCSAEIGVEVKDKNNTTYTQTLSILVYKQVGMLKADDVITTSAGAMPPRWETFFDYMTQKHTKVCIGLVGNSLEHGITTYIERLKELSRLEYFEIFNHGYDHVLDKIDENGKLYSEFYNTPWEQQRDHLLKTQALIKDKLGITAHTFGAPGNAIDSNTTKAMEAVADLKIWLYGNATPAKLVLTSRGLIETSTGHPDYNAFLKKYDPTVDYYVFQIHPNGFTPESLETFKKILDYLIQQEVTFLLPYEYYTLSLPTLLPAEIALSRTKFNFGSDTDGSCTPQQTLRIENKGEDVLNWTVSCDSPWITVEPSSGTGSAAVNISVNPTGQTAGTYHGTITVTDPRAVNSPQTANITLVVYNANTTNPPFGSFDTPGADAEVSGSIPVTGWALDDIGVKQIKIYSNQTLIGEGTFVDGTRPDIETAFPDKPLNYRAGWGYMLLTNCLPGGGNGVYTLNVFAVDVEGHEVKLDSRTITVDNKNSVKPFGAIDTPTQGGIASGRNFVNYGWVLTPMPNMIPIDGSTIHVFVDGFYLGKPVYNNYRADIENLFPGYANSSGAVGYFNLDTTKYENGVHTIAWTVKDNAGNEAGIGSRFFVIKN